MEIEGVKTKSEEEKEACLAIGKEWKLDVLVANIKACLCEKYVKVWVEKWHMIINMINGHVCK